MKKIFGLVLVIIASFLITKPCEVDAVTNSNFIHNDYWFTEKKPVTDYDYSFAVVGDTQVLTEKYPKYLHGIYDWIVDNVESKKIAHVFGLGDITETWVKPDLSEWNLAKQAISKLDGVVPYSLVRGNHDETKHFNNTFNYKEYTDQFLGFYEEGQLANSYKTFKTENTNYLFITLDYGPSDDVLEWAGSLCDEYYDHKVIITTHAFMDRYGNIMLDSSDNVPCDRTDIDNSLSKQYNTPQELWDKFFSKYGNIMLIMSGHDPSDNVYYLQNYGEHANLVTSLLIDAQWMDKVEPVGMICMLYINEEKQTMTVEFYSTVKQQFCKETNQYTLDISKSGTQAHNYVLAFDDTHHWYECECEAFRDLEAHNFTSNNGVLMCDCGAVVNTSNNQPSNSDDGCSGSIVTSIFSFGVLLTSIEILKKKKIKKVNELHG